MAAWSRGTTAKHPRQVGRRNRSWRQRHDDTVAQRAHPVRGKPVDTMYRLPWHLVAPASANPSSARTEIHPACTIPAIGDGDGFGLRAEGRRVSRKRQHRRTKMQGQAEQKGRGDGCERHVRPPGCTGMSRARSNISGSGPADRRAGPSVDTRPRPVCHLRHTLQTFVNRGQGRRSGIGFPCTRMLARKSTLIPRLPRKFSGSIQSKTRTLRVIPVTPSPATALSLGERARWSAISWKNPRPWPRILPQRRSLAASSRRASGHSAAMIE